MRNKDINNSFCQLAVKMALLHDNGTISGVLWVLCSILVLIFEVKKNRQSLLTNGCQ